MKIHPNPHFVYKRGHNGRYRFTLLSGDARLKGEVRIDSNVCDRSAEEANALLEIRRIAEAFVWVLSQASERRP